jgi:hypothetical protein
MVENSYALLMSSVFGANCRREQLLSVMKNVKSKIRTSLTDEHLVQIPTEITHDPETLLKKTQCQIYPQ